jgi:hypothetical protein
MDKLINTFESCEDCYDRIGIIDMVVKDTPDGICIYCRKCTDRHKLLEKEAEALCRKWGLDVEKLKQETEKEERHYLRQSEEETKKEKRTTNA